VVDELSLMWQSEPARRGAGTTVIDGSEWFGGPPNRVAADASEGGAAVGSAEPFPSIPSPADPPVDPPVGTDDVVVEEVVPLERLEAEICSLAGRLASLTREWLVLVGEFDRRKGWAQWGIKSCAHWLSWACSVTPGAAREYVRVAAALAGLPLLDAAFGAGRLSYSKVRAVTRVAGRVSEQTLLEQALVHTAAQLERVVRGYRRADGAGVEQQRRRRAQWFFDEDGMLVLTARLPADEGGIVVAALEQARHSVIERHRPVGADPPDGAVSRIPMCPIRVPTRTRTWTRPW
jgi:Domain of unknown function (DUF222)